MPSANISEEVAIPKTNEAPKPKMWPIATVMATGIFATTFVQTQSLAYLPFNHLLAKMGYNSDTAASFLALCILPWSLKIIAGVLVDGLPLFGSRRKAYLLLSALAASATWLVMACMRAQYYPLLVLAISMNAAIVFGSTASGGLLVEAGQLFGASGRLSSLRVFAQTLGSALSLYIGGELAEYTMGGHHPLLATGVVAIIPLACMFLVAWFLLRENGASVQKSGLKIPWRRMAKDLICLQNLGVAVIVWCALHLLFLNSPRFSSLSFTQWIAPIVWMAFKYLYDRHRQIFWVGLLIMFVQAVPTFRSTCFYQLQIGPLHYTDDAIGKLNAVGPGVALLSAGVYAWWCRRSSLVVSLYGAIFVTALSALPYLFYSVYTPYMPRAMTIESVGTFLQYLAYLPLFDLIVRCTPKGSEALGYAVLISVWNIGLMIGTKTGPTLYEHIFNKNMNTLIWLNAGVTLAGLVLVFLVPRALVEKREGA